MCRSIKTMADASQPHGYDRYDGSPLLLAPITWLNAPSCRKECIVVSNFFPLFLSAWFDNGKHSLFSPTTAIIVRARWLGSIPTETTPWPSGAGLYTPSLQE
ncbi:hypothetical protein J3459_018399 [Metarhizium acridum]|nr:hypothetical protein J3459_018399 [Metarhizium acridum]